VTRAYDTGVEATLALDGARLTLTVHNSSGYAQTVRVAGGTVLNVPAHSGAATTISTDHGWYDVTLSLDSHDDWARRFAGHVENGQPSRTG